MVQKDLSVYRPYNVVEREETNGLGRARESSFETLIRLPPLYPIATMSETIQIRQKNPEESDNMAKLTDADGDVYGYLSRQVSDELGEYMSMTVSEEADVTASLDGVTGNGSGNFATFETPGGAVVGLGISLDVLEGVLGFTVERDGDDVVQNAPESVGLSFASSTEEDFEESEQADEEEVAALVGGSDSDESEDESEEEVEISDEELKITE